MSFLCHSVCHTPRPSFFVSERAVNTHANRVKSHGDFRLFQFEPIEPNRNEIQVFTNPQFGEIRTAGTPDNPLFCLADLCRVLELTNITEVRNRLKRDGLSQIEVIDKIGRKQMVFISEKDVRQMDTPKKQKKTLRKSCFAWLFFYVY